MMASLRNPVCSANSVRTWTRSCISVFAGSPRGRVRRVHGELLFEIPRRQDTRFHCESRHGTRQTTRLGAFSPALHHDHRRCLGRTYTVPSPLRPRPPVPARIDGTFFPRASPTSGQSAENHYLALWRLAEVRIMFKPRNIAGDVSAEIASFRDWLAAETVRTRVPLSSETIRHYASAIRSLLLEEDRSALSPEVVRDFVSRHTEGRKSKTYNLYVDSIRKYSEYRGALGRTHRFADGLARRPCDDVRMSAPLTRSELDSIVRVAQRVGDRTLEIYLRLAWDTMGRPETELCGLRWKDVRFGGPFGAAVDSHLALQAQVQFHRNTTIPTRKAYVWWPGLADDLKAWKASRRAPDADFVFRGIPSYNPQAKLYFSGHLNYEAAARRFKEYARIAGLDPKPSLRMIRSGCALWLHDHRLPLEAIMKLGGWHGTRALCRFLPTRH